MLWPPIIMGGTRTGSGNGLSLCGDATPTGHREVTPAKEASTRETYSVDLTGQCEQYLDRHATDCGNGPDLTL
jgi:acyl-homoserine lactone acylase PvdQ